MGLADADNQAVLIRGFDFPGFAAGLTEELQSDVADGPFQGEVVSKGFGGADLGGDAGAGEHGLMRDVAFGFRTGKDEDGKGLGAGALDLSKGALHFDKREVFQDDRIRADGKFHPEQLLEADEVEMGHLASEGPNQIARGLPFLLPEQEDDQGAGGDRFKRALAKNAGVDPSSIQLVNVSENALVQSYLQGLAPAMLAGIDDKPAEIIAHVWRLRGQPGRAVP